MDRKKKISIITVCYNAEKLILNTLKSILNQTYCNLECIVLDGNSTDNTIKIIQSINDSRIQLISEEDKGTYDAMNKGINRITGEIVAFLNAGDMYPLDALENVVNEFNDEIGILYGDYYCENDGNVYYRSQELISKNDIAHMRNLNHQSIFVKKSVFDLVGYFNLRYKICADYDWLVRALKQGVKLKYIDKPLCYYEVNGISSKNRDLAIDEEYEISNNYLQEVSQNYSLDKEIVDIRYHNLKATTKLNTKMNEAELQNMLRELRNFIGNTDTFLFGGGLCLTWFLARLKNKIQFAGIIDNSSKLKGKEILGYKVFDLDELEGNNKIVITNSAFCYEISKQLEAKGYVFGETYIDLAKVLKYE